MVAVNGVRYRPEDAPKQSEKDGGEVQHKARKPAATAKPSGGKTEK